MTSIHIAPRILQFTPSSTPSRYLTACEQTRCFRPLTSRCSWIQLQLQRSGRVGRTLELTTARAGSRRLEDAWKCTHRRRSLFAPDSEGRSGEGSPGAETSRLQSNRLRGADTRTLRTPSPAGGPSESQRAPSGRQRFPSRGPDDAMSVRTTTCTGVSAPRAKMRQDAWARGSYLDDEVFAHLLQAIEAVDVGCPEDFDGANPVQRGAVGVDVLQHTPHGVVLELGHLDAR